MDARIEVGVAVMTATATETIVRVIRKVTAFFGKIRAAMVPASILRPLSVSGHSISAITPNVNFEWRTSVIA